jgi:hypothetical protein
MNVRSYPLCFSLKPISLCTFPAKLPDHTLRSELAVSARVGARLAVFETLPAIADAHLLAGDVGFAIRMISACHGLMCLKRSRGKHQIGQVLELPRNTGSDVFPQKYATKRTIFFYIDQLIKRSGHRFKEVLSRIRIIHQNLHHLAALHLPECPLNHEKRDWDETAPGIEKVIGLVFQKAPPKTQKFCIPQQACRVPRSKGIWMGTNQWTFKRLKRRTFQRIRWMPDQILYKARSDDHWPTAPSALSLPFLDPPHNRRNNAPPGGFLPERLQRK